MTRGPLFQKHSQHMTEHRRLMQAALTPSTRLLHQTPIMRRTLSTISILSTLCSMMQIAPTVPTLQHQTHTKRRYIMLTVSDTQNLEVEPVKHPWLVKCPHTVLFPPLWSTTALSRDFVNSGLCVRHVARSAQVAVACWSTNYCTQESDASFVLFVVKASPRLPASKSTRAFTQGRNLSGVHTAGSTSQIPATSESTSAFIREKDPSAVVSAEKHLTSHPTLKHT